MIRKKKGTFVLCATSFVTALVLLGLASLSTKEGSDGAERDKQRLPSTRYNKARDLRSDRQSDRSQSLQKSFSDLPPAEKVSNIRSRLDALIQSSDLFFNDEFVDQLLTDLGDPGFLEREVYQTAFTGVVTNLISKDTDKKMEDLAKIVHQIGPVLQSHDWETASAAQYLSSAVFYQSSFHKFDLLGELAKIDNEEHAESLRTLLIPEMVVREDQRFHQYYQNLPPEERQRADQEVMEISALRGRYQMPAVELYLSGGGEDGLQEELPSKWVSRPNWIWEHSEELTGLLGKAASTERKDAFVSKMIVPIASKDPEVAASWVESINDPQIRLDTERILKRLTSGQ